MYKPIKRVIFISLAVLAVAAAAAFYFLWFNPSAASPRTRNLLAWLRNSSAHLDWAVSANTTCGEAPFAMPTSGFIGYLWDDSFRPGHRHQGIDIFGGDDPGVTPIYAAYDGYLSRLPDWKSSLIIRIPADPLEPSRQVWTYYTHMAYEDGVSLISANFPPGTSEWFVKAGTLLGYQGNYSGTPGNPTGVHLHFSIIRDDGKGKFLNELEIENTLDPSPYLGFNLNNDQGGVTPALCQP